MHDLALKTKRAEFVLSPLSFTTSRKIIITPYNYASTCNLFAVTPCICAPTCKLSNGHSFNFPFLNIKRRSFPPFQLPPLTISSLPCIRLTQAFHLPISCSTAISFLQVLLLFSFQILHLHFLVPCTGFLYIVSVSVLCFSLHLLFRLP